MPVREAVRAKPVRPRKSAEIVASHLRLAIVDGELAKGAMLPVERDLIETFGVSRATMREALRILEAEGLLEVARGAKGGARVVGPTLALAAHAVGMVLQAQGTRLLDVQLARQIIEPPAARMVAERSARERRDIASALRRLLAAERDVLGTPEFPYRAMEFHETLVQFSGNRTLTTFLLVLHEIHEGAAAFLSRKTTNGKVGAEALAYHERLVDLIVTGDGAGAEALWREYWRWITPHTHPEEAIVNVLRNLGD
jgi:DNA-binding FadR family transcriptional regulator